MQNSPRIFSLWNWVVIFCKGKFGKGVPSVFAYMLNILNDKVFTKISVEDIKKYSAIILAVAELGEKILALYVMREPKKIAMETTIESLKRLASYIEDGKVSEEEFAEAIEAVSATIDAWKSLKDIKLVENKD